MWVVLRCGAWIELKGDELMEEVRMGRRVKN